MTIREIIMRRVRRVRRCLLPIVLAACGGDPVLGEDTGSTCPPTDPPTFASFGQGFMQTYCLDCHSQLRTGDARQGAPVTIDFDTRSLVRENTSRIDQQAGNGLTTAARKGERRCAKLGPRGPAIGRA